MESADALTTDELAARELLVDEEFVRWRLKDRQLSAAALAEHLHLSEAYLSMILHGHRRLSPQLLYEIAALLDLPPHLVVRRVAR